jgi:hypothetical protein
MNGLALAGLTRVSLLRPRIRASKSLEQVVILSIGHAECSLGELRFQAVKPAETWVECALTCDERVTILRRI